MYIARSIISTGPVAVARSPVVTGAVGNARQPLLESDSKSKGKGLTLVVTEAVIRLRVFPALAVFGSGAGGAHGLPRGRFWSQKQCSEAHGAY